MTIGFTQLGSGQEHVLMMHDWGGDHSTYDPMLPYLDEQQFTYVFADLRGYGKSRSIAGDYSVTEIAADCLALADSLGLDSFHVVGHSMTGMVTQRLVLDAPERIKTSTVVCAVSAAGSPMDEATWDFFSSTTDNDDAFRQLMMTVTKGLTDRWAEAKLRQNRATSTLEARQGYLTMFAKTDFSNEVRGVETPFFVVVGANDYEGLNEAAMKRTFLVMHPSAELLSIPNCGHYPMQECPPYFASIVEAFMHKHA